jgi:hypothetical protein
MWDFRWAIFDCLIMLPARMVKAALINSLIVVWPVVVRIILQVRPTRIIARTRRLHDATGHAT